MKRRLSEAYPRIDDVRALGREHMRANGIPAVPPRDLAFDNAVNEWGAVPYPQLSALLAHLRFLALLHQTSHWTAKGDPFYGDHKLFERLYEGLVEDIDDVAEKAVGLGDERNVDLQLQAQHVLRLAQQFGQQPALPSADDLARRALMAEVAFLAAVERVIGELREVGLLRPGVENMLQALADRHDRNVYLLKRRCAGRVT